MTPLDAATAERHNPRSRLSVLPADMFAHYFTHRYLATQRRPVGVTHVRTITGVRVEAMWMAPDGDGVYAIDEYTPEHPRRVRRFARDGAESSAPTTMRIRALSVRVACLTRSGRLAVSAHGEVCLLSLAETYCVDQTFDTDQFEDPSDIVLDRDGNLVVCDPGRNQLQVFTEAGKYVRSIRGGPMNGRLSTPRAVAVHPDTGHYYVAEYVAASTVAAPSFAARERAFTSSFSHRGIARLLSIAQYGQLPRSGVHAGWQVHSRLGALGGGPPRNVGA